MTASVVITTKNRREDLLKAVESVMAQRGLLEVVVIDDGSTDGAAEELKKKFSVFSSQFSEEEPATSHSLLATAPIGAPATSYPPQVTAPEVPLLDSGRSTLDPQTAAKPQLRLIRHEESRGLIVRRNEGARVARGNVIFSLDDDAFFSSPFVVEQTLRDFSHPRIGAVAIPYIEPHKVNKEMQRAPTREDIWITASYIGTAHAVRRDVFLALGGYREHLVHQGEEGDFCIRMLAAEKPIADGGGLKANSAEGVKALDSGPSIASAAPATLTSEATFGRLPRATPCAGGLDAAPLSAVQGFFVRLGNSDPIIHNESPKRDYSRMDFYGRRNDVLFHWQNTPMPDLLWQLPKTIAGGLVCAAKVGRWRKMLEGIGAGFVAIAGGVKREPISNNSSEIYHQLKKTGPVRMAQ